MQFIETMFMAKQFEMTVCRKVLYLSLWEVHLNVLGCQANVDVQHTQQLIHKMLQRDSHK